jgi:prepilin-type N-terminal cleavage/methylation domain-containing protein
VNIRSKRRRRGFSLIEVLVALTIMGTLLTAAMTALDTSFKSYKVTTEGASTHVIARMVMSRIMTMMRTGTEFGPYPIDPLDPAQNPVDSSFLEFVSRETDTSKTVIRIERRDKDDPAEGPYELWYVQTDFENGVQTALNARPLLSGVQAAQFTLEYDVGQHLRRATVDLTIRPTSFQAASIGGNIEAPPIRLVSSVNPRRLD